MKTAHEILASHLQEGYDFSNVEGGWIDTGLGGYNAIIAAMEEYRSQHPAPRPIEELFELPEGDDEIEIWVKSKRGKIIYCSYNPCQQRIFVDGGRWSKREILSGLDSFIPVQPPKFL